MINKLTPEQEEKIPLYVQKWVEIGLSTEPFSQEEAEGIVWAFQSEILEKKKTPVIVCDNPIEAWRDVLKKGLTKDQLREQVSNKVRDQVWTLVEVPVWHQIRNQVSDRVEVQVSTQVETQVWDLVWELVGQPTKTYAKDQIDGFVWPYLDGSFSSYNFSFYDFFLSEGIVKLDKELAGLFNTWTATSKLGLIYPLEGVCLVSQKPSKIMVSDGEIQIHYKDGWEIK